ncbi:MAG: hypothetical protein ACKVHP_11710, partial [Verrucomicrobiales bacterium]
YVHFRIVENSGESNLFNNQYTTDFQGLYLAIEQLDSRFMRAHDIPEGNLYKMENGTGEKGLSGVLKNTAPFPAVSDYTDLETFKKNGYEKNPDEAAILCLPRRRRVHPPLRHWQWKELLLLPQS